MKPHFISAIDDHDKPCAVKGHIIGSVGRGFVAFRPCESDDHICIHERFVYENWLYALRRARRSCRRYRQGFLPSGRNGYVTTRLNGAIKARIDGRKGPEIQVRSCDGMEKGTRLVHSQECSYAKSPLNGVEGDGRDSLERQAKI